MTTLDKLAEIEAAECECKKYADALCEPCMTRHHVRAALAPYHIALARACNKLVTLDGSATRADGDAMFRALAALLAAADEVTK